MSDLTIIDEDVHSVTGTVTGGRLLADPASFRRRPRVGTQARGTVPGRRLCPRRRSVVAQHRRAAGRGCRGRRSRSARGGDPEAAIRPRSDHRYAPAGPRRPRRPDFPLPDLDGSPHGLQEWQGRRSFSSPSPAGAAAATTFPVGRNSTTSWPTRSSPSSPWPSTIPPRMFGPGSTASLSRSRRPEPSPHRALCHLQRPHRPLDRRERPHRPAQRRGFRVRPLHQFTGVESGPHMDAVRRWVTEARSP